MYINSGPVISSTVHMEFMLEPPAELVENIPLPQVNSGKLPQLMLGPPAQSGKGSPH